VQYAAHHEKEWQMASEQRERLEETVESLARQHMSLEKAMNKSKRNLTEGRILIEETCLVSFSSS